MSPHRTLLFPALALLALATPARAGELDRYLPADSEVVVNVNFRQLLDSPMVKKHALEKLREALKDADQAEEILKELGFDPFKDLDRVLIAGPGGNDPDRGLLIAHGRFDRAKFKTKAEEAARDHGDVLKSHQVPVGGKKQPVYEVVLSDGSQTFFVALPDDTTLLASTGKDYVVDAMRRPAGAKVELKDRDFQALLEGLDDRASLSLAAVSAAFKEPLKNNLNGAQVGLGAGLDKITAVAGGLTLGDDIKLEVSVSAKNAADAREVRDSLDQGIKTALALLALVSGQGGQERPGLELALDVVKGLKVTAKGKTVSIKARVSAEAVQDAFKKDK
jgi:hypothetical protein